MPAVLVALMVLVLLLFGLGAVLFLAKGLRAEADRMGTSRPTPRRDS